MSSSSEHPGICHWKANKFCNFRVADAFVHFKRSLDELERYVDFSLRNSSHIGLDSCRMGLSQLQLDVLYEYKKIIDSVSIYGLPKSLEREYDEIVARPKFIVSYDPLQRVVIYRPLIITFDRYTPEGYLIFDEDPSVDHSSDEIRVVMLPARQHQF